MNEIALLDCIEWVSLGMKSHRRCIPAGNSRLPTRSPPMAFMARCISASAPDRAPKADCLRELSTFQAELYCNGKLSQRGSGALVLDSPLLALRHLGEIISTGTVTTALPVIAGETWTTKVFGIPLGQISLRFESHRLRAGTQDSRN